MHRTRESELVARGNLRFDVELRSGVFADEHGSQARANAFLRQAADFVLQFREDFVANFGAVKDACSHFVLAFVEHEEMIAHAKKSRP